MAKYIRIRFYLDGKAQGGFITPLGDVMMERLFAWNPHGEYRLTLVEMTEDEYEKLPEFPGF